MTRLFSPEHQLKAFINASQYFAGLRAGQDIWEEAGNVLINFFGLDFAAFGERDPSGVVIRHRAFSGQGASHELCAEEMNAAVEAVFEDGFLNFYLTSAAEPMMVACFPVLHDHRVISVMVVGLVTSAPFSKKMLDLYLGVAGLIGATYSRNVSENALLRAKEDWERTFEAVPDLMALLDLEYRIVRANRAMAQRLGLTPAECVGLFCYQLVHGTEEPPSYCPYRQVLRDGEEHHVEERLDKLCGHFFMSVSPLVGKDGVLLGAVHVARDVSERKTAEEKLRQNDRIMMQQSRQAAMGEMIGNIAHQWRQPLNGLGLIIQEFPLMSELGELTTEEVEKSVDAAMKLIMHMSQTINDFSNFFKPEKERVLFEISKVIRRTVSIMEGSFSGLRIEVEVDADLPLLVKGYPNEYSQVLLNILSNARDALEERKVRSPRITIRVSARDEMAVVAVSDNAGGIAPEAIDKIFDPYFTTKGPDKGTGVGLFMSKTIIEQNMKGRLTVRNAEEGAEFTVEVQLDKSSA